MPMTLAHTQALLGKDAVFIARCKVQLLDVADDVLVEQAVAQHVQRAAYARQVVQSPEMIAVVAAQYLARSTNVTAAGIDVTDQGPVALITDVALLAQVSSSWNILAGIDEGSSAP